MENLNSVNLNEREKELANSFSDRFRRVWFARTKMDSVCITTFPLNIHEDYRMYFANNVQDYSLENLRKIVLSQIEK